MRVEIARRLEALDSQAGPVVDRFDTGAPFKGRIAVLPSAFNPPTLAHLELLERALAVAGVDRTAAMLSTRNVAKGVFGALLPDRIEMLLALHKADPTLGVLASNSARLVDQAAALRENAPEAAFDFVVGYDTLVRLFDPGYYKEMHAELEPFFAVHRVIAANRGRATVSEVARFVEEHAASYGDRIVITELSEAAAVISSMDAREAVANGGKAEMLPPPVEAYIRERGLYMPNR